MPGSTAHLLDQTQRRLAAIVESSDDAIVSKDLDGIVQSWNQGAERIFGYTAEEMVGRSIRILIPAERQQEEELILGNIREGRHLRHYGSVRLRKDGTPIHVSLTVSPLFDDHGRVVGASKIARDITDAKRMETALQEATLQKDRFLATLAHELRNPLVPLRNALDLMKEDHPSPLTAMMDRQLDHLTRLVGDLMDMNRITMGRIELRPEVLPVAEVLNTAVETVAPSLEARRQTLEVITGTAAPRVRGDRARLVQVLVNLLDNASKYTPEGGRIEVRVRTGDGSVQLHVKDNGRGFPPGTIQQAFELFTQIDRADRLSDHGLGIGLHIVKNLVQLHGGRIEALSAGEGQGSEFVVHLAAHADTERVEASASPERAERPVSKRVLVADDNEDAAFSMSAVLGRQGHEVMLAHNGMEAVRLAREFRPDMVIMDIGMPELNGYEACKQIRATPEGQAITMVALSGWGEPEDKQRSRVAGFDQHWVKPISPTELRGIVAGTTHPPGDPVAEDQDPAASAR